MRRKYKVIVLGMVLTLTSMNMACAADDQEAVETEAVETEAAETETAETETAETEAAGTEAAGEEIYGEVSEVGEDSLTIAIGELANAENEEEPEADEPDEEEGTEIVEETVIERDGEVVEDIEDIEEIEAEYEEVLDEEVLFSMDYTGEEVTIALTENTVFTRELQADEEEEDTDSEPVVEMITLDDICVGDIIKFTLDENGNAATVTVIETFEDFEDEELEIADTEESDETAAE